MPSFSISKLFELSGIKKVKPATPTAVSLNLAQATSISPDEQKVLLSRTFIPSLEPAADPGNILAYLDPIHMDIANRKSDNNQMRKLAPEIDQAASIMIPSIMAPNDLQSNTLTFTTSSDTLPIDTVNKLNTYITNYFSSQLKLDKRLATWLNDIIYGSGCKPILILPELYISTLIERELVPAKEGMCGLEKYLYNDTLYANNVNIKMSDCRTTIANKLDLYDDLRSGLEDLTKIDKTMPLASTEAFTKYTSFVEDTIVDRFKSINDLLTIHDNPSIVGLNALRQSYNSTKIKTKLSKRFEQLKQTAFQVEDIISFDDIHYNAKGELGHPLMMELPPESVIPVHTPGVPDDHIGYFVILDNLGNPITTDIDPHKEGSSALNSSFNAMFSNRGITNFDLNTQQDANILAVSKIYEGMLDNYINKYLNNMDLENIEISRNENIYKCMFRRLLANKQTKMIFVPSELLIYYRFQTNNDGTGRSKLEDIKFVLSLRITLLVSKIMSAMDEAITRQKLSVTFDESIANPLATMKMLKSKFIENKIINFTYNPTQIVKSIADRGLTIVPSNIPGLAEFTLDSEPNNKTNNRPDDVLMEDLRNMFILGLEVPPSALNNLSEDEYSRSIATTNLFFSKKVRDYQGLVCGFTSTLVQTYIRYSKPLKDGMRDIIGTTDNTIDVGGSSLIADTMLEELIRTVTATLPSPNIAPDKAQYEECKAYDEIISMLLDTVYNTTLAEKDKDAAEEISMIKAHIKNKIMREYLSNSGFGNSLDLPNIDTLDTSDVIKTQQAILNFRKRLIDNAAMLSTEANEGEGGVNSDY